MSGVLLDLANAATAVGGLALLFAILPFRQAQKQRLRDAEHWYVERYWAIQDRIPIGEVAGRLVKLPSEKDLFDELRLCEDELDLRQSGFITNATWRIWSASIQSVGADPAKMSVLARTEEMELLRLYLTDGGRDPMPVSRWTTFVRGLA